jgi:competence protein ComGC
MPVAADVITVAMQADKYELNRNNASGIQQATLQGTLKESEMSAVSRQQASSCKTPLIKLQDQNRPHCY